MLHKFWNSKEEMPYFFPRSSIKFQGHMGQNITNFDPNWAFPDYRAVAAFKSLRFALSRSYVKLQGHTALKIVEFDPNWAFPDCTSSLNSPMAMKCCTKLQIAKERCPSNFKVTRDKKSPILTRIERFRTVSQVWIQRWVWNDAQNLRGALLFLAATKQLYEWFRPSVCPSRLSVHHTFLTMFPLWLCIIMKFSGVITSDRRDIHAKVQGQRLKIKVTEGTTQFYRFRTVTPVWLHIWWWNDAYSLIMLRRGALLFFKVIHQISRSHRTRKLPILTRIERFRTVTPVIHRGVWDYAQSLM